MNAWQTVELGQVASSVDYGVTASATQQPLGPKFRITDIQNGAVDWEQVPWCQCDPRSIIESRLQPGDIVFARTGATTGKSFLIRDCPPDTIFASYLIRVRLGEQADPRYVSQYFQTPDYWAQVTREARGVAQPGMNASILKRLKLPLPSMTEQRRIAAILDKADELRANRRAALTELDKLAESIFLDLFGDANRNPKGWPVRPVADYVLEFEGGKSIDSESGENVVTQNRVLKVSSVTSMRFADDESKPVPDSYEPPRTHFVQPGDLLFSRANTTELVGAVAYVDATPPNLLLPDKLWRFIWRAPLIVEPLFVWFLFQTSTVRREIQRRATGTSGSMKNISQEKLFGISTIVPPIRLQREFAGHVASLERLRATHRASLAEMDALFLSLQHRAFRGEL